jgi:hypothetical protein
MSAAVVGRRTRDFGWIRVLGVVIVLAGLCTRSSDSARADTSGGSGDFIFEVTTCTTSQQAGAGTNDPVSVTFQTEAGSGIPAKAWLLPLKNPGDMQPGQTDSYRFSWPTSALREVRYLENLVVHKQGQDLWCINRLRLLWREGVVFEWKSSDTQSSGNYVLLHIPVPGPFA